MDPKGRFNVYVEYDNEMLVLGAVRAAERIIEALDNYRIEAIDVGAEVCRLRELARIGDQVKSGECGTSEPTEGAARIVRSDGHSVAADPCLRQRAIMCRDDRQ